MTSTPTTRIARFDKATQAATRAWHVLYGAQERFDAAWSAMSNSERRAWAMANGWTIGAALDRYVETGPDFGGFGC